MDKTVRSRERESHRRNHTGAMTAPVTGSNGAPACTANVPKLWTGVGARAGVSTEPSSAVKILSLGRRGSGDTTMFGCLYCLGGRTAARFRDKGLKETFRRRRKVRKEDKI